MSLPQATEATPPIAEQLQYVSDNGKEIALPQWAQSCFVLGRTIVRWDDNRNRMVIGVALPTRAYGALLIVAGVVLERTSIEAINPEAHFQRLMELSPESALVYNCNGKRLHAVFDFDSDGKRAAVIHGKLRLRVRVQTRAAGGLTYFLDATQALRVQVLHDTGGERALSRRVPRQKAHRELFLKNLLPHIERDEFLLYPRLDCLVIGTKNTLRNELRLLLASSGRHGMQQGTLQDILKVRSFSSEGHPYRSDVLSVDPEVPPEVPAPYATLFDGALGFLKWRDAWRHTHWIVVLDRTEPHFAEAVNILNQEYASDRLDTELPALPRFPNGMDVLLFKEVR